MFYEYVCRECGNKFDVRSSIDDRDEPRTCGACGAGADRQLSRLSVNMKNWRDSMRPFRNETKPFTTNQVDKVNAGESL